MPKANPIDPVQNGFKKKNVFADHMKRYKQGRR